jgi:hypothetical protein
MKPSAFLENSVLDNGILDLDVVAFDFAVYAGQGSLALFIVVSFGVIGCVTRCWR